MLNAWTIVSGVILASIQLIQDSAFDVDSFVADRIGEAIGRKLAKEAVSGTGSTACLGILTALNARGPSGTVGNAITATGGYVQLSAARTVPVFGNYSSPTLTELNGNLISPTTALAMVQSVDPVYYPHSAWFMSPAQAWNLRSVTDANGRPLINFMNGFNADDVRNADYTNASAVGNLFGFPVIVDSNIPALNANGISGPVFGDLSRAMVFRIVRGDGTQITMQHPSVGSQIGTPTVNAMRLTERYADYLQVGYIGYLRCDMRSNDLRAAVAVRSAAT